jgi:hypothetical protein
MWGIHLHNMDVETFKFEVPGSLHLIISVASEYFKSQMETKFEHIYK